MTTTRAGIAAQCQSTRNCQYRNAQNAAIAAWAKLKMPVVVYTTTIPVAYNAYSAPIARPMNNAVTTASKLKPGGFGTCRPLYVTKALMTTNNPIDRPSVDRRRRNALTGKRQP